MAVVKFLGPLPPEKQAYALARYSRSADPVEDSLAWVEEHSAGRFWETFYFDYGHASIADLGHVAVCFEGISELAAIEVLDEQLWDGQARSTRYQNFADADVVVPPEIEGGALEAPFREAMSEMISDYLAVHADSVAWLRRRHPRPDSMKEKAYERNVAARAFDMARSLLPLSIPTSVGQVTSIRTLEKQVSRLLTSDLAEVRALGERLIEGCRVEPASHLGGGEPPAPTLARHARADEFRREWRRIARARCAERLSRAEPPTRAGAWLAPPVDPEVEMAAGLLHECSGLPWAELCERVAGWEESERRALIAEVLEPRGRFDELPREARVGYRFVFDIVMDVGGWRDMHRHRRCQQLLQEFDLDAGAELPPDAHEAGIADRVLAGYERALDMARRIAEAHGVRVAACALPLMHRVRCAFKMDFAEADYIARLRSGVKGHPSYRKIAWDMYEEMTRAVPALADLLDATPPTVEDPLVR